MALTFEENEDFIEEFTALKEVLKKYENENRRLRLQLSQESKLPFSGHKRLELGD